MYLLSLGVAVYLAVYSVVMLSSRPGSSVWWIAWAVHAVMLFVLAIAVNRAARGAKPSCLIPRRLAAGECGACAYPISTLPPEADGCTVCPECGAAWELEDETGEKEQMAK